MKNKFLFKLGLDVTLILIITNSRIQNKSNNKLRSSSNSLRSSTSNSHRKYRSNRSSKVSLSKSLGEGKGGRKGRKSVKGVRMGNKKRV